MQNIKHTDVIYIALAIFITSVLFFCLPSLFEYRYIRHSNHIASTKFSTSTENFLENNSGAGFSQDNEKAITMPEALSVIHLPTPEPLKGLYMTSWVAGTIPIRDHVVKLVDTTEANAVVVDLKDYSGKISYPVSDPELLAIGSVEKRIPDLKVLTNILHTKKIYVIGRIAVFQDPYFGKIHPEYAVKRKSDKTKIWKDYKGISWLDAGEKPVWDYVISIAKDAYSQGVDEIQFDYIRFPSDGNMQDIYYPVSEGKPKAEVMKGFYEYVKQQLSGTGIVTSADLFGLTTLSTDDMGIGQVLENALNNFDYVSPMVYPSHFPLTWMGFSDPEAHPYEVIKISMSKAVERATAINASSTKLRPWLQDFGLRMDYGPAEVRKQIQATYDVGLTSWLLWDPTNEFTKDALQVELTP